MNKWIATTLYLLATVWQAGVDAFATVWAALKPYATAWLIIATTITIAVIVITACLIGIGIALGFLYKSGVVLSMVAIPIGLLIAGLWVVWTPLAVLVGCADAIVHGRVLSSLKEGENAGTAYLYAIQAILLYELTFCLIASLLPFWKKWELIPAFIAVSIALGLAIKVWGGKPIFSRLAYPILIGYFIYIIGMWVFPGTTGYFFSIFSSDHNIEESIKENGVVGSAAKGLWKVAFGAGEQSSATEQLFVLTQGTALETVAVSDRSTVYFESDKAFCIVERTGINDDGSEQLTHIKMPAGKSQRFFTWGGTIKLKGMFDNTNLTIKY